MKVRFIAEASLGERIFKQGKEADLTEKEYKALKQSCELINKEHDPDQINRDAVPGDPPEIHTGIGAKFQVTPVQQPTDLKNILVIKCNGIGNIVLITPVIIKLHEEYPEAKIDLLVDKPQYVEVLRGWELLNKIYIVGTQINTKYNLIFNGLPTGAIIRDNIKKELIKGAIIIEGDNNDLIDNPNHEIDINFRLLKQIGITGSVPDPFIPISLNTNIKIGKKLKKGNYIAVAAGFSEYQKNGKRKNWGYKNYADLIRLLLKKHKTLKVLLLGLKDDRQILDFYEGQLPPGRVIDCCGKYSIQETAALIKRCKYLICNDSGLMHVAEAVGTKSYAIFTATIITKNKPRRHGRVISNYQNCSPCYYKGGWQNCQNEKCKDITPEEVFKIIETKQRFQLGIIVTVYNRYELLLMFLNDVKRWHDKKVKAKFVLVDDCSTDNRVNDLMFSFKKIMEKRGHTVELIKTEVNNGQWGHWKTLKLGFDNCRQCDYIFFTPPDSVWNPYILEVLKKSFSYLKGDIKTLSYFKDTRNDKEKCTEGYRQAPAYWETAYYDGYYQEVRHFDGFGNLFKSDYLEKLIWDVESPKNKNRGASWTWFREQILADGKALRYMECLAEHTGNINSAMNSDIRIKQPLYAIDPMLIEKPHILFPKKKGGKRLNLGCGDDIRKGYINIDFRPGYGITALDLQKKLPYEDNSIDEIIAQDILEHFSFRDTERIFKDWVRVLSPRGRLFLLVPNFEVHYKYYQEGRTDPRYQGALGFFIANIFGGQDYEGNFHKTLFTPAAVEKLCADNGITGKMVLKDRAIIFEGVKA